MNVYTDGPVPGLNTGILGEHDFKPKNSSESCTFRVTRGDYSKLLSLVVDDLSKAKVSSLEK